MPVAASTPRGAGSTAAADLRPPVSARRPQREGADVTVRHRPMAMMAPVEAVAHVLSEDLATDAHEIGCYPSSPGSILGSAAWFGAWAQHRSVRAIGQIAPMNCGHHRPEERT